MPDTTRLACYLEVTAQFRPDLTVLADLDAVLGDRRTTATRNRRAG